MSDLAEERKTHALRLLKEAEFEIIELTRDKACDLVALHDAKVGIWDAMERVEALGVTK